MLTPTTAPDFNDLDNYLDQLTEEKKAPGLIFLLHEKGKLKFLQKYGWQDIENEIPLEFDTIFRIHSMTKPIIAVALMILFDEGKFELNDPISKFLPEFSNLRVYVKEDNDNMITEELERDITILDLFTHTSGLSAQFLLDFGAFNDPIDKLYYKSFPHDKLKSMSLERVVKRIPLIPLRFQPGRHFKYGFGLDVLGRLIEVLSERPLDEFLDERLFQPLDMSDTGFRVPREKLNRFAKIYIYNEENELEIFTNPGVDEPYQENYNFLCGGGGLVSSTRDFYNFTLMCLDKGRFKDKRLLDSETIDLITKNHLKNNQTIPTLIMEGDPIAGYFMGLKGYGQGLGVRVLVEEGIRPSAIGEYGWAGAAETFFWVDPLNEVIGLLMIQVLPDFTAEIQKIMQLSYKGLGL
ncbi:MAG: serine hydrolase domain-containing protein [Candidatus Hodarchaeota archaeon]